MRDRDQRPQDRASGAHRIAAGRHEPNAGPRTSPMGPGPSDSVLGLQQVVGNAEVSRRLQRSAGEDMRLVAAGGSGHGNGTPVARMISVADFRDNTAKFFERGRGDKISQVDAALEAYHALPEDDYQGRLTQLGLLDQAGRNYQNNSTNASRNAQVRTLLDQVAAYQVIYDALVSAGTQQNDVDVFRDLIRAQDAVLEQWAGIPGAGPDHELSHFNYRIYHRMSELRRTLQPHEMQTLMQDDLRTLTAMSNDPGVPGPTRNILTELLGNRNIINFQPPNATGPGTRRTGPHQYDLGNAPHHLGGTTERVGALAHELTHVDAGEAYQNTDILLLFDQNLNDPEISQLVTQRRRTLDNLMNLLNAHQGLSEDQRSLFASKLDYAGRKRLNVYADNFLRSNRIDPATHARLVQIEHLTAPNSAVLVEYDTVINQLLIYLHRWGVPQTSPLYAEVLRVAEEQRRQRHSP